MKAARRYQDDKPRHKHGDIVDVEGTPCLFLDSGTRKGVWLSPRAAACVLANDAKLRVFLAKHPYEPVVQAKPAPTPEVAQLLSEQEDLRAQLRAAQARVAQLNPVLEVPAVQAATVAAPTNGNVVRFNPLG